MIQATTPERDEADAKYDFWGGRYVSLSDIASSKAGRANLEQMRTFMDRKMDESKKGRAIVKVHIIPKSKA